MNKLLVPRVYIDSNVFDAVIDDQTEAFSRYFFSLLFNQKFIGVCSAMVDSQFTGKSSLPERYWRKALMLVDLAGIEEQELSLAKSYIDSKILPQNEWTTALHVAIATASRCDYLVSWNHRYIVNISATKQYQAVNKLMGLQKIHLISPAEFILPENR